MALQNEFRDEKAAAEKESAEDSVVRSLPRGTTTSPPLLSRAAKDAARTVKSNFHYTTRQQNSGLACCFLLSIASRLRKLPAEDSRGSGAAALRVLSIISASRASAIC